jgi:hypothetical protein
MCTTSFLQRGLNLPAAVFFYRRSWRDTVDAVFTAQDNKGPLLGGIPRYLRIGIPSTIDDDLLRRALPHHGDVMSGIELTARVARQSTEAFPARRNFAAPPR